MNGQWIGRYSGTSSGQLIVNVDDRGAYFGGIAYVRSDDPRVPTTTVRFATRNKERTFQLRTENFSFVHPDTGNLTSWEDIKLRYPEAAVSKFIDLTGRWDEKSLCVQWKSDIGVNGTSDLTASRAAEPSEVPSENLGWRDFRKYVDGLRGQSHLFRGQCRPWRLRTAFHRRGRADVQRFVSEDIILLHRHLSARTKHLFNLTNPDENGAFFNLVQHHGYPTPLLDWTYSPYVAAFFAYRDIPKAPSATDDRDSRVRVYILDEAWRTDVNQLVTLDRAFLHFSIAEFIAIENERAIPQQSVSAVANIDDIEAYIRVKEQELGRKYLKAVDLLVEDRAEVFRDLGYMGLTAGSLFPGFDGACEALREVNFS